MKRFAFLTDIHLDEQFPIDNNVNPKKNFEIVLGDLSKRGIKDIVFGGDIGAATAHNYFFESLKQFSFNLILGNHDNYNEVVLHYNSNAQNNELYYDFADKHYKYIFLDTSSNELSKTQLNWLKEATIASNEYLIFIHHPIISIETPVDTLYPLKNREELKSILLDIGENVTVFCGHYHMNDESTFMNIKQFTTPSLSFQIVKTAKELAFDNSNFGYRIIEISNNKITTELVTFAAN